jgi:putative endonuclease
MKGYFYILTNSSNSVLYAGVTSDLRGRILKHKTKRYANSFSARYNVDKLVYFETFETIGEAIKREKQVKGGSRRRKVELINGLNPGWEDLSDFPDWA